MNPTQRQPSTYRRLLRQVVSPKQQPITTRDMMAKLHAAIPPLKAVVIEARPGVVRASLDVRWYVYLGLGLWHRSIRRRAQAIMDKCVVADFTGTVRFASVPRAIAR